MKRFSRLFLTVVTAVALFHEKQPLPSRIPAKWRPGEQIISGSGTTVSPSRQASRLTAMMKLWISRSLIWLMPSALNSLPSSSAATFFLD
jgi:hypothetical protein